MNGDCQIKDRPIQSDEVKISQCSSQSSTPTLKSLDEHELAHTLDSHPCEIGIMKPETNQLILEVPTNFQSSCLQLLQCHGCDQIIYPPIYCCKAEGHAFCHTCKKVRKRCKICKSKFSTTRNLRLESIASLLKRKCSNYLCEDMLAGFHIDEHKAVCQFRPVSCFDTAVKKCKGQPVNFENYVAHLLQVHQSQIDELKRGEILWIPYLFNNILADANRSSSHILKFGTKLFIFQVRKYSGTEICFTFTFLGSNAEAEGFQCILRLQKPFGDVAEIQWKTLVHSIHTTLDVLHAKGNLFVISDKTIEPFCHLEAEDVGSAKVYRRKLEIGVLLG